MGAMRFIGRTNDGSRVYVEMELRHRGPEFTTTGEPIVKQTRDHQDITEYDELAITGCIVPKRCRNAHTYGQIQDDVQITDPAIGRSMVRDIFRLWKQCHLNGMHAACIHQDKGAHVGRNWQEMAQEQNAKCPNGYRYGSAWLVDVLASSDIDRAQEIMTTLNNQPEYTGN